MSGTSGSLEFSRVSWQYLSLLSILSVLPSQSCDQKSILSTPAELCATSDVLWLIRTLSHEMSRYLDSSKKRLQRSRTLCSQSDNSVISN
ncbi:hypothetical protein DFH29DRAFT_62347 [Suillus ampliporus]|nr:hypothetical protein DFH29DRAFT_62347 [Suillus ampliporus]